VGCTSKDNRSKAEAEVAANKRNDQAVQEAMKKAEDVPSKIKEAACFICDETARMWQLMESVGQERCVRGRVSAPLHKY
jgi:hypothetical protein